MICMIAGDSHMPSLIKTLSHSQPLTIGLHTLTVDLGSAEPCNGITQGDYVV
jgi:hypothetical protein